MTVVAVVVAAVAVGVPRHVGQWVDAAIHTQSVHSGNCSQLSRHYVPLAFVASPIRSVLTACAATANRFHSSRHFVLEAFVANSIHPMAPPH